MPGIGTVVRTIAGGAAAAGRGGAAVAGAGARGIRGAFGATGRGIGFLSNVGFAVQSWAEIFARYYPSISQTVHVKAQGGPDTSGNEVVHTALATVFGCLRQSRLGSIELTVALSHTENTAEVIFKISSLALVDALNEGAKLADLDKIVKKIDEIMDGGDAAREAAASLGSISSFGTLSDEDIEAAGELVARAYRKAKDAIVTNKNKEELKKKQAELDELTKAVQALQEEKKSRVPGTVRKGGPDDSRIGPPIPGDNTQPGVPSVVDQPSSLLVRKMLGIYKSVSKILGQGVIWNLGRQQILGGIEPDIMKQNNPGAFQKSGEDTFLGLNTFSHLKGKPILTRVHSVNPQMPNSKAGLYGYFGFGTDLRSLVAQVLHDPGVRPPSPQTNLGPMPVLNEEKGV